MSVKNQLKRKMKKEKLLKSEKRKANAKIIVENKYKQFIVSMMLHSDEIVIEHDSECEFKCDCDIETETETFACLFCPKSFKTESELDNHASSHSAMAKTYAYFQNQSV